ncbi:hypothetical protein [Streptomyces sp. NPDC058092]|uniref:hypothetical protein n=1 Tax=Streptomyces sp. NPDC058092 TaxID=3346336 RepID=UPI0036E69F6A
MNDKTTQTLQAQGSPILLLAYLHKEMSHLTAPSFTIHGHAPTELHIHLHRSVPGEVPALTAFEEWRTALGLGLPSQGGGSTVSWLSTEGRVDDVAVVLTGYGTPSEVEAAVAELVAA